MKNAKASIDSGAALGECIYRAVSSMEKDPFYHGPDVLAAAFIPGWIKPLLPVPFFRTLVFKKWKPDCTYEYSIARTKLIDKEFKAALEANFDQIVNLRAGYDTRALRFNSLNQQTEIFELDPPSVIYRKIGSIHGAGLELPGRIHFATADINSEPLSDKLKEAGFQEGLKTLYILEGLSMHLEPEALDSIFQYLSKTAADGSVLVFDYIDEAYRSGNFRFGMPPAEATQFLKGYSFRLREHYSPHDLERLYFSNQDGTSAHPVNDHHCLIIAEK